MAISFRPFRQQRFRRSRRHARRSSLHPPSQHLRSPRLRSSSESLTSDGQEPNPEFLYKGSRSQRRLRLETAIAPKPRLLLVWVILMIGMVGLSLNLFRLQVLQGDILQERAKAQQTIALSAALPRRPIVDREGNVLAIDKPIYTLYAHPILFEQQRETIAVALAPILNKPMEQLLTQISETESGIRLAEALPEDKAKQIRQLHLDGLELLQQQERLYPQQELFANIVGYVNADRQAQAGVEYSQDEQLIRSAPEMRIRRSGDGSVIPLGLPKNLVQYDELQLQLTLDSRLQRATRYALKQQMQKYSAKRGVVIVMDVQDGSILALASEPTFDANQYYNTDQETLRDWVVTDVYEPGSTFKPINLAIALESGAVKPNDVFIDEGAIRIGEWPIQNSDYDSVGARGPVTVTEILQNSSNVGMVHVMQRLKPGVFYGWLERLKLGEPTGIDLPFESSGQVKPYSQFTTVRVEPATTAFGQGFSLTPIKLIQLHSTIANGGKLVTPHVVKGMVDTQGKLKWQPEHPKPQPVFTPKTTEAVLKMMEQAVLNGTGQVAQIPGFRIAGKTGTAQKASQYGGYSRARITSFIGILPVEAPRYAVLAVVDEPQGDDAYGSTVAAPIVKEVMEALIASERIPPTKPDDVGLESVLPEDIQDSIDFHHPINPLAEEPTPATDWAATDGAEEEGIDPSQVADDIQGESE
ncbi:penicillin-binding protein 2 [Leptolyngbya sp. NK1-12]|uniref:Penicillin-binding protein 2 n=1 Tax=Leptolyngbya sp. NK1-12 TaxID=2547451 RepID=A0AA97AL23_9CYAN|nr:penicillin-binding protein 2 [Leptolyngbya sp. NK1-12]WNZ24182.1 penicillin-binding protein 2 [Leptolyngbya sp. NK1-12]